MAYFYRFKVNMALSKLGIDPAHVDTVFRQQMQIVGEQSGNTPQEVALWIGSQLPLRARVNVNFTTIKGWLRSRKINPDDAEVHRALLEIGWF